MKTGRATLTARSVAASLAPTEVAANGRFRHIEKAS